MARRQQKPEPIRKSFLIFGGVVLGVAVLAFVLTTFVFGGGGGDVDTGDPIVVPTPAAGGAPGAGGAAPAAQPTPSPTPTPEPENGLTPGGRDPFIPQAGAGPVAAEPAPTAEVAAASFTNEDGSEPVKISVLNVYGDSADLKLNDTIFEGVKQDQVLTSRFDTDEIKGDCVYMKENGDRFKVCKGKSVKR